MADTRDTTPGIPHAVVRERILDLAEADPDASLAAIADEVGGATPELVGDVLSECGDSGVEAAGDSRAADAGGARAATGRDAAGGAPTPDATAAAAPDEADDDHGDESSGDGTERTRAPGDSTVGSTGERGADEPTGSRSGSDRGSTDAAPPVDPAALSELQREALRAIHRRPDATQASIASDLGVVRATVSDRLTDVDGFEWYDRRTFVERLFDEPAGGEERRGGRPDRSAASATAGDRPDPVDAPVGDDGAGRSAGETPADLADRLAAVESAVARPESPDDRQSGDDPELLYKGIEVIVATDRLADREAVALIRRLL